MIDGSVRLIDPTVSDEIVGWMIQRNDGQNFAETLVPEAHRYARKSHILNKMRQLTLASHNHESARAEFPAHATYGRPAGSEPLLSWRVEILPYLGYRKLYSQFNHNEPWDSPTNLALIPMMPDLFSHPFVEHGKTVFRAITSAIGPGPHTMFPLENDGVSFGDITDGSSNSIMFVETEIDQAVFWTQPVDLIFDPLDPKANVGQGAFRSGFSASRADGSAIFVDGCISDRFELTLRQNTKLNRMNSRRHLWECWGWELRSPTMRPVLGS